MLLLELQFSLRHTVPGTFVFLIFSIYDKRTSMFNVLYLCCFLFYFGYILLLLITITKSTVLQCHEQSSMCTMRRFGVIVVYQSRYRYCRKTITYIYIIIYYIYIFNILAIVSSIFQTKHTVLQ